MRDQATKAKTGERGDDNIINNLVAIDSSPFLHLQNTSTRGHGMRYIQPNCRTQTLRESFFPTAIYIWYQLPATLITTPT